MKTLTAAMTAHIQGELTTLATCWHITRTDGVELFITDHDADIVFAGDTYAAATGIARTAIESASDMSVDNLDVVGILGGAILKNELLAGHYDFAEFDIFSVNWVDPDGFGKIQHRFGTIGEIQVKDGSYTGELRGMMQLLERQRGKVYAPDCRANLFSPLIDPFSARATGCGLASAAFEEFAQVVSVTNDRQFIVNEFSQEIVTPEYEGAAGDVVGVHEVDGKVEMVLDIADGSPMRPIVITNNAGMVAMANDLNGHYVLGNDVELVNPWVPVGTDAAPFRGTFDGRGFKLLNMIINTSVSGETAGLFGTCSGVVRRVHITRFNCASGSAAQWSGAICGRLLGEEAGDHPTAGAGRVEDCYATAGIQFTDGDLSGGLIGEVGDGTIVRGNYVSAQRIGAVGTDVGACVGRSAGTSVIATDNFANTDHFTSTDLGNITGGGVGGYVAVVDDDWILPATWPTPNFDFNDQNVMNIVGSTAATIEFEGTIVIKRASGNFITDGMMDEDHMTIVGSVSNDGTYIIRRALSSGGYLVLSTTTPITAEAPVAVTYACAGGPRHMDGGRF